MTKLKTELFTMILSIMHNRNDLNIIITLSGIKD